MNRKSGGKNTIKIVCCLKYSLWAYSYSDMTKCLFNEIYICQIDPDFISKHIGSALIDVSSRTEMFSSGCSSQIANGHFICLKITCETILFSLIL